MALKKEVEAILNEQLVKEFDAAVVYYGMSIYFPLSDINPKYRDLDFYRDCAWGEFLEKYLASRSLPSVVRVR